MKTLPMEGKNWLRAPGGGLVTEQTGRLTVGRKPTLTLTQSQRNAIIEHYALPDKALGA
jgi:hypothetical protein